MKSYLLAICIDNKFVIHSTIAIIRFLIRFTSRKIANFGSFLSTMQNTELHVLCLEKLQIMVHFCHLCKLKNYLLALSICIGNRFVIHTTTMLRFLGLNVLRPTNLRYKLRSISAKYANRRTIFCRHRYWQQICYFSTQSQ